MLASGEPQQEIILEYARSIRDGYFKGLTPAAGAQVVVVGEEVHEFHEDSTRPGIYHAAFAPQPGLRYTLRIRGPAGEVVTAETLVPEAPNLVSPGADTIIAWGGYVSLRWSSVPSAAAYVFGSYRPEQPSTLGSIISPAISSDLTATVQPGPFAGTSYHYRVAAVDSNYMRYTQRAPVSVEERAPVYGTITGAIGLFGSYALSGTRTISVQ
jgi:hypothetical protein